MINIKKERIEIPIYFSQSDDKEVFIDEDSIFDVLREDLKKIQEKPENYLAIEI